jgi:site-specific DNA-methyltransferase (adenine-specific)
MSNIQIKNGDALTELALLKSNSVDLIIADPPYNLGKNYENNFDNKEFEEYLKFSRKWLQDSQRVLKEDGTIYVFMGVRFISYLFLILDQELKMIFNSWVVWHYTQGLGKTKGFSPRHDDILMFTKSSKYKFNLDEVRVPQKFYRDRNNMRGANPGDVWGFSHVHYCNENRQDHPTQKPEGLIERMVLASTNENDFVIDPFSGSGTTLRVCQQLKRKCLGIELNKNYVKLTEERLKKPFDGFDGTDPRMERIPKDLNNPKIREKYFKNHKEWFLKNHEDSVKKFEQEATKVYGNKNEEEQENLKFM